VAEQDAGEFGGSGGGSVDGSEFVDGWSVAWVRVGMTIAGSVILGWALGVIEVITSTASAVEGLINGARDGIVSLIGLAFNVPSTAATDAWRSAGEFVSSFGVVGYLLAMLVVMATLWTFSKGVGYVGT